MPKPLVASSLGCAAGVMLYVGCAELFGKSEEEFSLVASSPEVAKLYTTLCFFAGAAFVWLANLLVHNIAPSELHDFELSEHTATVHDDRDSSLHDHGIGVAAGGHDHRDGAGWHAHKEDSTEAEPVPSAQYPPSSGGEDAEGREGQVEGAVEVAGVEGFVVEAGSLSDSEDHIAADLEVQAVANDADAASEEKARLYRAGLTTVLAIALHNFPEGLATFLAARTSARTGLAVAFGVILHNIPEGLCVAAPIYAATRSPTKAIGWAVVAGLAELFGGIVGQVLVSLSGGEDDMGPLCYGILYGVVNGIVVMISAVEFLPTAVSFDETHNKMYASGSFLLGMVIIATTLVVEAF